MKAKVSIVIAAVVGFAGTYKPEVEEDFAVLGQAEEVTGWKCHSNSKTLKMTSNGEA